MCCALPGRVPKTEETSTNPSRCPQGPGVTGGVCEGRLKKGQGNTPEYEFSLLRCGKWITGFLLALSSWLAQCEPLLPCWLPEKHQPGPAIFNIHDSA